MCKQLNILDILRRKEYRGMQIVQAEQLDSLELEVPSAKTSVS